MTSTLIAEGVTPQNGGTEMSEQKTVPLVPTWGAAMSICIMCLDNPNASIEGREAARAEIMRLARAMDEINERNRENDHE